MSISKFLKKFNQKEPQDQYVYEEGTEYHVKVNGSEGQHSHDLIFGKLKDAREYKKIIKLSKPKYTSRIIRREYTGGFVTEELAR